MIKIDIFVICLSAFALLTGFLFGAGKYLKFLSRGLTGKITSVVICYFLFGVVLSWGFVQSLLSAFVNMLSEKENWFLNILVTLRIDIVVFAIALFIVVQILRKFCISVIANIFESDTAVMKIINKVLGILIAFAFFAVLFLIFLQLMAWTDGYEGQFAQKIAGSIFKIDKLFTGNPLNSLISQLKK